MAGTLSGGEQQMLAIGRAIMSKPKLMMFDEPSLGLAPNIVEQVLVETVGRILPVPNPGRIASPIRPDLESLFRDP